MNRTKLQRAGSFLTAVSLVAVGSLTLVGCSPDSRIAAIDTALQQATEKTSPYLIGILTGDVTQALADAGESTEIMVPIMAPDLSTVDTPPAVTFDSEKTYETVEEAVAALAEAGQDAWENWLPEHQGEVDYVASEVPATVVMGDDDTPPRVTIDTEVLAAFAQPFAETNVRLFVEAVEALPQWQQTMAVIHAPDVIEEVTGLPTRIRSEATVENVESTSNGAFQVTLSYPDPKAVATYQTEQALSSYGTGKIWGTVTKEAFEIKRDAVTDIPDTVAKLTTKVDLKVTTNGEGSYLTTENLKGNLSLQAERYAVEVWPGSFTAPTGLVEAKDKEVSDALAKLTKQTIKEVAKPGTKRTLAGGSGQKITIRTGKTGDKHLTFFKWGSNKAVVSGFIKSGKTLTLRVPRGTYRLVYATGEDWYGQKYSFGPNGSYQEFKASSSTSGPMKFTVKSNYTYTIWIETSSSSSGSGVPAGSVDNPFSQ